MPRKPVAGDAGDADVEADQKKKGRVMVPLLTLYRYANRRQIISLIGGMLCAVAIGVAMPLFMVIFGDSIDIIANPNAATGGVGGLMENLAYMAMAVTVAGFGRVYLCSRTAIGVADETRRVYLKAMMRQEMGFYDSYDEGALAAHVSSDIDLIQDAIGDKVPTTLQVLATFVAGFTIGFIKSWRLGLALVGTSPLLAGTGAFFGVLMARSSRAGHEQFAEAVSFAEDVLAAIRIVIAFGGAPKEVALHDEIVDRATVSSKKASTFAGVGLACAMAIMYMVQALALWYGSTLVEDGIGTTGDVFTAFFAVLLGAMSVGGAAEPIKMIMEARAIASNVYGTIDRTSEADPLDKESGVKLPAFPNSVTFEDVELAYPTRPGVKVLKGVNFQVAKGQTIALVGQSGSGKSSCVSLLERFYSPQAGRILLGDSTDLADINIPWLRSHIALVAQEPVLFGRTIYENIAMGDVTVAGTKLPSRDRVIEAAKIANAHDFISQLPQGYDTHVGERGASLSGGQKQRVAIARALMKDPALLLLDEATSALDSASELIVQRTLDKVAKDRMCIVVAHRLSTIRDADQILVFDSGNIVERGTYDELVEAGGVFAGMVSTQTTHATDDGAGGDQVDKDDTVAAAAGVAIARKESLDVSQDIAKGETSAVPTATGALAAFTSSDSPLRRSIALAAKLHPITAAIGTFFTAIGGAGQPLGSFFLVQVMFSMFMLVTPGYEAEGRSEVDRWVTIFVFASLGIGLVTGIRVKSLGNLGANLAGHLRSAMFNALMRTEVAFFDAEENSVGALAARLSSDTQPLQRVLGGGLGVIGTVLSTLVTSLLIAYLHCVPLAGILTVCMPVLVVGGFIRLKLRTGAAGLIRDAYNEAGAGAGEAMARIRTIAGLGAEELVLAEYSERIARPSAKVLQDSNLAAVVSAFTEGATFGIWALAFHFGTSFVEDGVCDSKEMFTTLMVIIFAAQQMGSMLGFIGDISSASMSARSIFDLLDRTPAPCAGDPLSPVKVPIVPQPVQTETTDQSGRKKRRGRKGGKKGSSSSSTSAATVPLAGDISLRDVSFHYPTRPNTKVLRHVDLQVARGETLGLVGTSGSGKSSIVSLVLRYYDVDSGAIVVDGATVAATDPQAHRARIGIVSQEPMLLNRSIRENVAYGWVGSEPCDDAAIWRALTAANAADFVRSMPDGLDTQVGREGSQLSGGQKQRIAIARALVRDPPILLLDEATSALDVTAEREVQAVLDASARGRTTIVVAHRLTSVRDADKIAVIEAGQVVELGSYDELIAARGKFCDLFARQV
jgi:ATP-binding cassette subfamily B (MDR/TAP) protein 1